MILGREDRNLRPWLWELPQDWQMARLSNEADVMFSNVDKHTLEDEKPVRLCNYTDVYNNEKITADMAFMEATALPREIERFQLRRGDVLATKDSESWDDIAVTATVSDELPGVLCGYHLAIARPRSRRLAGEYLGWLYQSKPFRAQYEAKATGVTRFGLGQAAFKQTRIPLPPADEQRRIAAYLDNACRAIDGAIDAKRKQLDTLADLRKSIIHKAVTRGLDESAEMKPSGVDWLGEIPVHWDVSRVKRNCQLLRGKFSHRPRNDPGLYDGDYPFIQTGDIAAADKRIRSFSQTLNDQGLSVSRMFPKGTLVMAIAANIGDVAIMDFEACFPDSIVGFVPNHRVNLDYLYYLLGSMKQVFLRSAVLTTQLNINYVRIGMNFAPLPQEPEQRAIAEHLDASCRDLAALRAKLTDQIQTLHDYRKSLIHECVTGKRRITDADIQKVKEHV